MRITVEEILDVAQGWIRFRSGAESVKGRWAGPVGVAVGREVDIEMAVSEEDVISTRPASAPVAAPVVQDGGEVVIVGRAERIGDDGVIEFRVGQDIVLLEPVGPLADIVEGDNYKLRTPELTIYPRDL